MGVDEAINDKVVVSQEYPKTFTEEFIHYCRRHHLPPRLFHDIAEVLERIPRYIRLRPQYVLKNMTVSAVDEEEEKVGVIKPEGNPSKDEIAASFGVSPSSVKEVEWLPHPYCYSLPRSVSITRASMYQRGIVSAMDAASMAAVVALRPCIGDAVWDVCCSPGMKLSLIADAIGETGVAVGTDLSPNRLFTARSVLKKHQVGNACLFVADGTRFSLLEAVSEALDMTVSFSGKCGSNGLTLWEERRMRRFQKRRHETSGEVALAFSTSSAREWLCRARDMGKEYHHGFDRVLVDAECSHDGSLAHIFLNDATRKPFSRDDSLTTTSIPEGIDNAHRMQRLNLSLQSDENQSVVGEKLSPLLTLQLSLLQNGYAQLKPGGTLVYCTCSFTYEQNEFIVREAVSRVNSSHEMKQHYKGEAVLCHPLAYTHETVNPEKEVVSPIVQLTNAQLNFLQERLKMDGNPYGISRMGEKNKNEEENTTFTGVRFWPHTFATSFQFVAKIWKRPLTSSTVE